MKRAAVVLVAMCVCLSFGFMRQQQDKTPRVNKREVRQQKRINKGIKSGQLTPKEANRLERQQVKIREEKAKAKSDGKVTGKERAKLSKEQNSANRAIYRKRHNQKKVDRQ
jgi:hypothetical protein